MAPAKSVDHLGDAFAKHERGKPPTEQAQLTPQFTDADLPQQAGQQNDPKRQQYAVESFHRKSTWLVRCARNQCNPVIIGRFRRLGLVNS
jgi:hypothetical protein